MSGLIDGLGRPIRDLRLSVTDRCNFFCSYCRDGDGQAPLRHRSEILSFEEMARLARILVPLGIQKIRLTGGEPLIRREIELLIRELARIEGLRDLAMTTNAFLLAERARALSDAGLRRLNISLDSTRPERFDAMVGTRAFSRVMDGILAALDVGFPRLRLNTVLIRGENEDEILDFMEFSHRMGVEVRFIEFMPLEDGDRWRRDLVVTADEILSVMRTRYEVDALPLADPSQTSREYRLPELDVVFGIIASVSNPFCGHCSRIRITADGHLRTCLFSVVESDLRPLLRGPASDEEIVDFFRERLSHKEPGHRIGAPDFVKPPRRMLAIGG